MSANPPPLPPAGAPTETGGAGGFNPTTRLSTREFQELGDFFKKLLQESHLAKWIVLAGLGAAIEILHILWLAARFLLKC
jgi:hypothetical protein